VTVAIGCAVRMTVHRIPCHGAGCAFALPRGLGYPSYRRTRTAEVNRLGAGTIQEVPAPVGFALELARARFTAVVHPAAIVVRESVATWYHATPASRYLQESGMPTSTN
jgi:hypothetical protein